MSSKQYTRQNSSWQPDRIPKNKKTNTPFAPIQKKAIEVANVAPNAMWDNVMRSMAKEELPATPPREFLQPKLAIGAPRDKYEQEADRTAKQVVQRIHAPEPPTFARKTAEEPSLQCKTEAFQQIWRPMLQAKDNERGETSDKFEQTLNRAKSGGQPLDTSLQRSMGEAIGADFSSVKVHSDATSHELNQTIQAKAFTTGQDVFFKKGAYDPNSKGGQELIAHELTHVVQQNPNSMVEGQVQRQLLGTGGSGLSGNTIQRTFEQARERAKAVFENVSDDTTEEELDELIAQAEAKDNNEIADEIRALWASPDEQEATEATAEDRYENGNPKFDTNGNPLYINGNPKFDDNGEPLSYGGDPMAYQPQSAIGQQAFAPEPDDERREQQVSYLLESSRQACKQFKHLVRKIVKAANTGLPEDEHCYHLPFDHILKSESSASDKARRTAQGFWAEGIQLSLMDVLRATIVCRTDAAMEQVKLIASEKCTKILKSVNSNDDGKSFENNTFDKTMMEEQFYKGYGDIKYNIPIRFASGTQAITQQGELAEGEQPKMKQKTQRTRSRARGLHQATIRAELQVLIESMAEVKEKSIGHALYDLTRGGNKTYDDNGVTYHDSTINPYPSVRSGALKMLVDPRGRDLVAHNFTNPQDMKAKLLALAGVTEGDVTNLQQAADRVQANPDDETFEATFKDEFEAMVKSSEGQAQAQDLSAEELTELDYISKQAYTQAFWMKVAAKNKDRLHKDLKNSTTVIPPTV